ncbi:hypothetical protein FB567DRAFT_440683 [Paraphoma chrysanthemicola]|uniref:F-box domain-containing protein n=1 Tax=Paraphoma chrysanthemicola TaxID=798071 RepID=A0A8K0R921_9PLEO|nr:hypothetical protein FB567DRAFT_440683 [Paraphoma chrysanthemicola]
MAARAGVSKRRVSHVPITTPDAPSLSFMEDLFGEEFPEAFANAGQQARMNWKSILDLPAELLAIVSEDLSKLDIKRLRLSNKYLAQNVDLRIDRVFVSPNRTNLVCLDQILNHPRYKFQVKEIVWDDAQLDEYLDLESFRRVLDVDDANMQREIENMLEWDIWFLELDEHRKYDHDDFFAGDGSLTEIAKGILLRQNSESARDIIARNAMRMSVEESWDYYQLLYEEEQDIITRRMDAVALRRALETCPNLRKITLTSAVWHPWQLQPCYHTPFHRSLPPGFRKPSVWPWLSYRPHATSSQVAHRDNTLKSLVNDKADSLPKEFRGYTIVVSTLLATNNSTISEFIIDPEMETTGISHQLFATPSADWYDTASLAFQLPLTRLKLCINSYGANHASIASYLRSGQIKAVLHHLLSLEHFDFSPNCYARRGTVSVTRVTNGILHWQDIIPDTIMARLKSLTIRNANMIFEEVEDMIISLASVHHVTLDNIFMLSQHKSSTYYELFRELQIHYGATASEKPRPAFTAVEPISTGPTRYRAKLVCEELSYWVHGEGGDDACPFNDSDYRQIKDDVGWVVDDRDREFSMLATDWVQTPEGRRYMEGRVLY